MSSIDSLEHPGHPAQQQHRDHPAQQRATLGPPGQAHGAVRVRRGAGPPGPGGHQATAEVPPLRQGHRQRDQQHGRHGWHEQRPPAVLRGQVGGLDPADGRQPDQPVPADVPAARTTKATPNTISPAPDTVRACTNSWARHRRDRRRRPGPAARSRPRRSAPPRRAARWAAARPDTPSPMSTQARAVVTSAAAPPAWRPTSVARSISLRPDSSSARACRDTISTDIRLTPRMAIRDIS